MTDIPPQAITAFGQVIQAYEPEAAALIIKSPAALLQVLLEAGRRAVEAAAPHLAAAERAELENLRHALVEAGKEMGRRYEMGVAAERERTLDAVQAAGYQPETRAAKAIAAAEAAFYEKDGIEPDAGTQAREHKLAQDMWAAALEWAALLAERNMAVYLKPGPVRYHGQDHTHDWQPFASLLRQGTREGDHEHPGKRSDCPECSQDPKVRALLAEKQDLERLLEGSGTDG